LLEGDFVFGEFGYRLRYCLVLKRLVAVYVTDCCCYLLYVLEFREFLGDDAVIMFLVVESLPKVLDALFAFGYEPLEVLLLLHSDLLDN
jgi:hypothetical protein